LAGKNGPPEAVEAQCVAFERFTQVLNVAMSLRRIKGASDGL